MRMNPGKKVENSLWKDKSNDFSQMNKLSSMRVRFEFVKNNSQKEKCKHRTKKNTSQNITS